MSLPAPHQQRPGPDQPTLYLAYGSNLSATQMEQRCPDSVAVGLAVLRGWRWLVNERGYANVVEGPDEDDDEHDGAGSAAAGVYGVLYRLTPEDEEVLDMFEGVPRSYEKMWLPVDVVTTAATATTTDGPAPPPGGAGQVGGGDSSRGDLVALVYVDVKRVQQGVPRAEYVDRMNRGIQEATVDWGLPAWYVDGVMRPFIPPAR